MKKTHMVLKGVAILAIAAAVSVIQFGCSNLTATDSATVSTLTFTGSDSLAIGTAQPVDGEITTSTAIDATGITVTITDGAGTDVSVTKFTISKTNFTAKTKIDITDDLKLTVTPLTGTTAGTYTLKVSVTIGSVTGSREKSFYVKGSSTTPVTSRDATLGASGNALGSSLDADTMLVYTSAQLVGNAALQGKIDVYFAYTASNGSKLGSPAWAKLSGWGPENGSWLTAPETQFKVAPSGTTFASVTTQEAIDALWGTTAGDASIVVAANALVLVKTTKNQYALINVISVATSTSGTAVLQVKIKS
ncbi:MAG: hypothetical protein JW795_18645 [Chitinivibrionales bacterium]|nr:hypothetical protein [Chitinivibrionales bacterium]